MLDNLYANGLLDKTKFLDERPEVEYYEWRHHEGRRARFGAAMMAPDYAWSRGFYGCKQRHANFMEEARELIEHNKKASRLLRLIFPMPPAIRKNRKKRHPLVAERSP